MILGDPFQRWTGLGDTNEIHIESMTWGDSKQGLGIPIHIANDSDSDSDCNVRSCLGGWTVPAPYKHAALALSRAVRSILPS